MTQRDVTHRTSLALLSFMLLLAACAPQRPGGSLPAGAIPPDDGLTVVLAQGPSIGRLFDPARDAGLVTEVLGSAEGSFNRVGLRFDATRTPTIEVAASPDGVAFGPWRPVSVTYRDGMAHNAQADLPDGSHFLRLRFSGVEPGEISFVFAEVFTVDPLALPDPGVGLDPQGGLGRLRSALAADGVAVLRSQWGALATRCTATHTPVRIAIHHTVTPNNDPYDMPRRVRQIQAYHMNTRGWCDIGYHFLVGQDGQVYQGREETLIGAHVRGHNTGTAGISFIGDFTSVAPSQAMMDAGVRILRSLSSTYGIPLDRTSVRGHREFSGASTACPGDAFYPRLDDLVARAATPPVGTLRGAVFWGSDFAVDLQDPSKRLAGATVTLSNGDVATTGPDGWYVFDVPAGTYTVTASAPGYQSTTVTKTVQGGATTWGSIMLAPVALGTVQGVVFWGRSPGDFSANIGDASKRLAGATVTFKPGGAQATTDASGFYRIDLPEGTYTVEASAPGYIAAVRPDPVTVVADGVSWGSAMVLAPNTIGVEDRDPPRIDVASPGDGAVVDVPELTLVGTVSDASPIAYLEIEGDDVPLAGGAFRYDLVLTPGRHDLHIEAADDLGNVATTTLTVTYVAPEVTGLQATIYDASQGSGAPIPGATVDLVGPRTLEVQSDGAGIVDLDLVAGTYRVSVRADGFAPWSGSAVITEGSRAHLEIGLERTEGGALAITYPAAGEILSARTVLVSGTYDPRQVARIVVSGQPATLADGRFSAEVALAPGPNRIVAIAYDTLGAELARETVEVRRSGGAAGCTSAGGAAGTGVGMALGLIGALILAGIGRRRRAP